jgi:hypothetical protein
MSWLRDRHYDKAPIKEAIIDIQVEQSPLLTLENFETAAILPPQGYEERKKLMMGKYGVRWSKANLRRLPNRTN